MTLPQLTIETDYDPEFECEDIAVKLNDDVLFFASRLDTHRYSVVYWDVSPKDDKEHYVQKLAGFYEALKTVDDLFVRKRSINNSLLLTYGENKDIFVGEDREKEFQGLVPLEQLCGERPVIFDHPHFNDFVILRAYTPWCDLVMEDLSGTPWKPETGRICVVTDNDFSTQVAQLIAETGKYSVSADQLQPVLKEKVYTFKE